MNIFQPLVLAILIVYAVILYRNRLRLSVIKISAIVIFILGIILHFIGFSMEHVIQGKVTVLLRSVICSLEMFLSENALLEMEKVQETEYFLDMYIAVYSAAIMTTVSAFISVFWKRALTWFNLVARQRKDRKLKHVFLGLDPKSMMLARDMKDGSMVFIEFPDSEKIAKVSISSMLSNVFRNATGNDGPKGKNITVLSARVSLDDLVRGERVLPQMGLKRLEKMVDSGTNFYILSDDVEKNLSRTLNIIEDPFFKDKNIHVNMKNIDLVNQYEAIFLNTKVHFYYASTMAANLLKHDPQLLPSSLFEVARDSEGRGLGYATKGMDALILGFGEAGQQVTRIFYEDMAIPGEDGAVLPNKIYVQDAKMEMLKGQFLAQCPGSYNDGRIVYDCIEIGHMNSWELFLKRRDSIGTIVLTMGDENFNLKMASQLIDFCIATRANGTDNLKVLIRKTTDSKSHDQLVWMMNYKCGHEVVHTFGSLPSLFKADLILCPNASRIDKLSLERGYSLIKLFHDLSGHNYGNWQGILNEPEPIKNPEDYQHFLWTFRNLSQFVSRYWNIPVKKRLVEGNEAIFEAIPDQSVPEYVPDPVVERLSVMEHERMKAWLTMNGYIFGPQNDELQKISKMLVPWEDMKERKKHLIRMVLKASFLLEMSDSPES